EGLPLLRHDDRGDGAASAGEYGELRRRGDQDRNEPHSGDRHEDALLPSRCRRRRRCAPAHGSGHPVPGPARASRAGQMSDRFDSILPAELREAARNVIEANRAAGLRIAVAESCTGGLVSAALTELAGSSDVFEAGFVTYSNDAKMKMLKVSEDVLETFGAVSIATAWSMAQRALETSGADTAVAITGIAGPGGGTPRKPVGTVVFARARRGAGRPQGRSPPTRGGRAPGAGGGWGFRRRSVPSSC